MMRSVKILRSDMRETYESASSRDELTWHQKAPPRRRSISALLAADMPLPSSGEEKMADSSQQTTSRRRAALGAAGVALLAGCAGFAASSVHAVRPMDSKTKASKCLCRSRWNLPTKLLEIGGKRLSDEAASSRFPRPAARVGSIRWYAPPSPPPGHSRPRREVPPPGPPRPRPPACPAPRGTARLERGRRRPRRRRSWPPRRQSLRTPRQLLRRPVFRPSHSRHP